MGEGAEYLNDQEDMFEDYHEVRRLFLGESLYKQASKYVHRYNKAVITKINYMMECPTCQKQITKKTKYHKFCSNKGKGNCKDRYHNIIKSINEYVEESSTS